VPERVDELLFYPGEVFTAVQQCPEFGSPAALTVEADERVGVEYRVEPVGRAAGLVPDGGEAREVRGEVAFMVGESTDRSAVS
jgi:hypothetical protein